MNWQQEVIYNTIIYKNIDKMKRACKTCTQAHEDDASSI
jgi:hypothetical protein